MKDIKKLILLGASALFLTGCFGGNDEEIDVVDNEVTVNCMTLFEVEGVTVVGTDIINLLNNRVITTKGILMITSELDIESDPVANELVNELNNDFAEIKNLTGVSAPSSGDLWKR